MSRHRSFLLLVLVAVFMTAGRAMQEVVKKKIIIPGWSARIVIKQMALMEVV